MMSELMAWAAGGAQGIPIPYSPRMGRRHYCYPVMLLLFVGLCSFP